MATTFVEYTGDGNATKQFTFPSYQESDVKVRVDGVLKTTSTHYNITSYTTTGGGNVVFTAGNIPSSPAKIRIYRDTNVDAAKATYTAGSSVKAADLNNNNTQLLYRAQEEQVPNLIQSYDIADQAIETSDIKDVAVTTAKIANSAVTSNKIADNAVTTTEILNGAVTTAKLATDAVDGTKLADNAVDSEHYTDGSIDRVHLEADIIDSTKLADNAVNSEHYVDGSIDRVHLAADIVDGTKIADDAIGAEHIQANAVTDSEIATGTLDNRYFTETELTNGALDGRYFTETESDARYFNISTGDTIKDGDTFPDNDTTIATTAAINDRIIDLVDDVGGFVPIANETSFPTANPDVNNGSGTLVSVKAISSTRTPNSGTVTIANGAGTGNTVTITGCGSTVLTAGFGIIVETTSTLHTYAFHRLVPKATEVTTVAGISSNITTVANNTANINTVAADASDIGIVAADGTDIGLVAGSISNVNTTAGSIANVNTVAGSISNVNSVASNISNVNAVNSNESNINSAVSNASNINSAVSNASNINTVAGSISNVNTTAGSISNVNTVASNISNVNSFANTYRIGSSNPTTSLDVGDLFFNTTANELKVYNGSSWQGGVTATGNFAVTTGNTFTGSNNHNDNVKSIYGTGNDLEIYHNGNHSVIADVGTGNLQLRAADFRVTDSTNAEAMIKADTNGSVYLYYDNAKKFETTSLGWKSEDNVKGIFGTGGDLQIFHSGTNTFIRHVANATGDLYLDSQGDGNLILRAGDGGSSTNISIKCLDNEGVELRHQGSTKLLTTSTGATVTGNIVVSGTVDGRDIATDGTKLDGIEASATADQTASEIVALVADQTIAPSTIDMEDDEQIKLGAGDDLRIYHSGSGSYIRDVGTGTLYLDTNGNDISLVSDGSVSNGKMGRFFKDAQVELYYDNTKRFETTDTGILIDGSDTTGSEVRGDFRFKSAGSSTTKILWDASGDEIRWNDSYKASFGTSADLQIYHSGSESFIADEGTGGITISSGLISFKNQARDETLAIMQVNAGVELYYDNSKKLETTTDGIFVTGLTDGRRDSTSTYSATSAPPNVVARFYNQSATHDSSASVQLRARNANAADDLWYMTVIAQSQNYNGFLSFSTRTAASSYQETFRLLNNGYVDIPQDNAYLRIGAGNDLRLFHDGTSSYLSNTTGNLYIEAKSGETAIQIIPDGAVDLRYNGVKKFETLSGGSKVTGELRVTSDLVMNAADNQKIYLGAGNDLQLFHNGTNSFITNSTGYLRITGNSGQVYIQSNDDVRITGHTADEDMAIFHKNGASELYYDNSKKLETTSDGAKVTGNTFTIEDTGDVDLILNADTDNSDESHVPTIKFKSDGGTTKLKIGVEGSAGDTFTGSATNTPYIINELNSSIQVGTNNTARWKFTGGGHFHPEANNSYDIGTSTYRVRNVYTNDLHLSNEGSSNDVDGSWGDWTIQEGESDLFLKNNRSGKKYKFNLTEVS